MATAEIVGVAPDAFTVRFEGPFCRMCCDYDYFEDLQYELARFDVDADSFAIASIEYVGDETFVVEFSVES